MSIEVDLPNPEAAAAPTRPETRVILRFVFGVTLAIGLSQLIDWPVGFITPVFLTMLLQAPAPLPPMAAASFILILAMSLGVGQVVGAFLPIMPMVCLLILTFLFFATFYWAQGGASQLNVVFVIIGLTLMPVVSIQSRDIANAAAAGLLTSGLVALLLSWVMFALIPTGSGAAPAEPPATPALSDTERMAAAGVMTAIIAPLAIAFLFFGWTQLIVLVIAAILVQQMSLAASVKGGLALVAANIAGGMVAVAIYYLLVAAPHFVMFMALMLLVALLFAPRIFSGLPIAALWGSAFTAVIIIVCGAVAPFGDDANVKLFSRVGQMILAVAYLGLAFALWQGLKGGMPHEIPASEGDQ